MKRSTHISVFLLLTAVLIGIIYFFVEYPPNKGINLYPSFALILFFLGSFCAIAWGALSISLFQDMLPKKTKYNPPAYQPMEEEVVMVDPEVQTESERQDFAESVLFDSNPVPLEPMQAPEPVEVIEPHQKGNPDRPNFVP